MNNLRFKGGNAVLPSTSTSTLTSKLTNSINSAKSMLTNNKTMLLYVLMVILFLGVGMYIYYTFINKNNTTFNANKEKGTNGSNGSNNSKSKDAELMYFYVDWCPYCKTSRPEWDSLKSEYEGKTINGYVIHFTEHNCTTESSEVEKLINQYKIEGYPTIKLNKNGEIYDYDAKPTKTTMLQFLQTVL